MLLLAIFALMITHENTCASDNVWHIFLFPSLRQKQIRPRSHVCVCVCPPPHVRQTGCLDLEWLQTGRLLRWCWEILPGYHKVSRGTTGSASLTAASIYLADAYARVKENAKVHAQKRRWYPGTARTPSHASCFHCMAQKQKKEKKKRH